VTDLARASDIDVLDASAKHEGAALPLARRDPVDDVRALAVPYDRTLAGDGREANARIELEGSRSERLEDEPAAG
jgi:hypothetical protein